MVLGKIKQWRAKKKVEKAEEKVIQQKIAKARRQAYLAAYETEAMKAAVEAGQAKARAKARGRGGAGSGVLKALSGMQMPDLLGGAGSQGGKIGGHDFLGLGDLGVKPRVVKKKKKKKKRSKRKRK